MVVTPLAFTVSVDESVVAEPEAPLTRHWNWSPVIASVVPRTTSVEVAEPP